MLVEVVSIPITATTSQVERAVIQTLPTSAVICTNEPDFFVGWRRLRLRTADDLERLKVDSPLTVVIFRATPFFHRVSQLLSVSTTKPEAEQWMRKLPVGRQKAAIASIVMSALEGSCSGQDFWDQSGLLEAEKLPDCEFSRSLQRLSSIEARRRGSVPIRTRLARGQKVLDLILADPYEAFQIYFANHTAVLIDSVFPSIPLYGMERRLKCEFHSPPVVIEEGPIRLSTAQDCLCLLEIVQRHVTRQESMVVLVSKPPESLAAIWRSSGCSALTTHQTCTRWEQRPSSPFLLLMEYHEVVPRLDRPTSLVIVGSPPLNPLTSVALRHYQATRGVDVLETFRLWSVAKHLGRGWTRMLFVGVPLSIERALRSRRDDINLPTSLAAKRVSVIKRKAVHKKSRIAEYMNVE